MIDAVVLGPTSLGTGGPVPTTASESFAPGSVLVAYTVICRTTPIDVV